MSGAQHRLAADGGGDSTRAVEAEVSSLLKNAGALLFVCFVCFASSCAPCSDHVLSNVPSPDSALVATAFVRNCGATTPYSSIVSVHERSNLFGNSGDTVFVAKGRYPLQVVWTAPRAIQIRCEACSATDVFRQVAILDGLKVSYEFGVSLQRQNKP
jgi:hypothetical protein